MAAAAATTPVLAPGESAEVRAVADGGKVVLVDGRIVALVGIAPPSGDQRLIARAYAALARMWSGARSSCVMPAVGVTATAGSWAHHFVGERWVEGELLRRGLARVASTADNRQGVTEMLRPSRSLARASLRRAQP